LCLTTLQEVSSFISVII